MVKKLAVVVVLLCLSALAPVSAATGCISISQITDAIDLPGGRRLQVMQHMSVDNPGQSTLRQKLLVDDGRPLTEPEARAALMQMFQRVKEQCRRYPLAGVIMFLYTSRDAAEGINWVARLDTGGGMTPSIDVKAALLAGGASSSMCEGPNAPKPDPSKKEYRTAEDVRLPPLKQRKVLGTWMGMRVIGATCSRSFEEVKGRVYEVIRCSDCSGGDTGTLLVKGAGNTFTRPERRRGDYFKILPNGDLATFDRDGRIDTIPKLPGLWPKDR